MYYRYVFIFLNCERKREPSGLLAFKYRVLCLRVILTEKKMLLSFKNSFLLQIKGKMQFLWVFKTEGYYEDLPIIYMLLENMVAGTLDWTLYDNWS